MPHMDHTPSTPLSALTQIWYSWPKLARWSLLIVAFFTLISAASPDQNLVAQTPDDARAKQISSLFQGPDGTHLNLSIIVQAGLINPDSFKHQRTTYEDVGEYLIVDMTYRAEDDSGKMARKRTRAKVDLTGKVISILENR